MNSMRICWLPFALTLGVVGAPCDGAEPDPCWRVLESGVESSLRGLCVVSRDIVWASGTESTVVRSLNGGTSWEVVSPNMETTLDFRDIHAFDAENAVILSAGQPARVYRTQNGGTNWELTFEHPDSRSFFDALSFWDRQRGIAMSDPIDGRVLLIKTSDGGKTWTELDRDRRPLSEAGEAGFAASGTNLRVVGEETVHIALGGALPDQRVATSRIVSSFDGGDSWTTTTVPMPRSQSAGIFSMAFAATGNGVAVGGDYKEPERVAGNVAVTSDGGGTWSEPSGTPPRGYRSGVSFCIREDHRVWVAVGPSGTDVSEDDGKSWRLASELGFHAVQFKGDAGFASGAEGRIAKWVSD